jgi:CubicO group peptidase (beta-lactamase class C family)
MLRRTFLSGLAAASVAPALVRRARAQGDAAGRIAAFVERVREHWRIPGVAVTVIHDGKRLMARGFGVKNITTGAKVDEHTAFQIGSLAKAYTACAAATAIEDGRAGWDVPVKKILPALELYDPQVTAAATLRDFLSHRVGLSRAWVGEYGSDLSRAQVIARAAQAGKRAEFRERMCYSNLGFVIAAEAIGRVSGLPFERYVDTRILQPLEMKDSTADPRGWLLRSNVADPHRTMEERQAVVPPMDQDAGVGSGSLYVSAHDAMAWLEVQLGLRRLVSLENLREIQTAQVTAPQPYGLGWQIGMFRKQPFVFHSGQTRGFSARTRVDPRAGYAVFAAANEESAAAEAIVQHVGTVLGRNPERDWIRFHDELGERALAKAAAQMDEDRKAEPLSTASALPIDAFAGTYRHGGFGTMTLRERDDALRVSIQDLSLYDGWFVRYSGMHFVHQADGYRTSKDKRSVTPRQYRVRFHADGGRIVAAEWLDTWFGSARFERVAG